MQKFLHVVEYLTREIKKNHIPVSFFMTEGKPIIVAEGVVVKVETPLRK